jgi:putative endonuclease
MMSNGQIYTGSSSDLKHRIKDHERGNVKTTTKYLPIILLGYEAYQLKSDAQRREKYMKTTEEKRLFRQQYRDVIHSNMRV